MNFTVWSGFKLGIGFLLAQLALAVAIVVGSVMVIGIVGGTDFGRTTAIKLLIGE